MPPVATSEIHTALRQGRGVSDDEFDRTFPTTHRYRSCVHWTPVDVAVRVGALLASTPGGRVLDVGAGVGKACLVGAMTTSLRWDGVERSQRMVRTARMAARAFGVEARVRFIEGDAAALDWTPYGGCYLYNPFAEAMWAERILMPEDCAPTYKADVAAVVDKLTQLPVDARVVTFHGFGGELPAGFDLASSEPMYRGALELWVRVRN